MNDIKIYLSEVKKGIIKDEPYSWNLWKKAYYHGRHESENNIKELLEDIERLNNQINLLDKINKELRDKITLIDFEKLNNTLKKYI